MIGVHGRPLRLAAAVLTLGLLGAACGSPAETAKRGQVEETTTTTIAKGPDTTAAQLRSKLNGLLQEHVFLTAAATGAAVGGRSEEFEGAVAAVGGNSDALTANITAIFGNDTGSKFEELWNKHVGFVTAYARGSASAVTELAQYASEFGGVVNSILPTLPAEAVTNLVAMHEQTLRAVIDAQKAGNAAQAYTGLRAAAAHMATVASGLTDAIAEKFPERIGGDPASKAAELVTILNGGLREHVFLAAAATGAALGGRADEFTAAKAALDANSEDLTGAVAGVYGPEAGRAFAPLWNKHIGFVVDYTNAVAARDQPKADEAMGNLLAYTQEFGVFINSASPRLTTEAVADLVKTHVLTLKAVIDAQAARKFTAAYSHIREAADHMAMIANGLATTIVAQFPTNF